MKLIYPIFIFIIISSCSKVSNENSNDDSKAKISDTLETVEIQYDGEKHFGNLRQLTNGGDNAEAYFSFDNEKLVFQSNYGNWGVSCDQIFMMDLNGSNAESRPPMLSSGLGRTTCSYFQMDSIFFMAPLTSGEIAARKRPPLWKENTFGRFTTPMIFLRQIFPVILSNN
jgi:TolB protein